MAWIVETLNAAVDEELEALPADQRARFIRVAELIEAKGLEQVRAPYIRHIRGPRREIELALRRAKEVMLAESLVSYASDG